MPLIRCTNVFYKGDYPVTGELLCVKVNPNRVRFKGSNCDLIPGMKDHVEPSCQSFRSVVIAVGLYVVIQ